MPKVEVEISDDWLEVIDAYTKAKGYHSRDEFIRDAIRDKLEADIAREDDFKDKMKEFLDNFKGQQGGGVFEDIIGKVIGRD